MSGRYDLSSAELDRERVFAACQWYIDGWNAEREQQREAAHWHAMRHRMFRAKRSPFEAHEYIAELERKHTWLAPYAPWLDIGNGFNGCQIQDLWRLAAAATTPTIRLTRADLSLIQEGWDATAPRIAPAQEPRS